MEGLIQGLSGEALRKLRGKRSRATIIQGVYTLYGKLIPERTLIRWENGEIAYPRSDKFAALLKFYKASARKVTKKT